jgi:hypothetical protein
MTVEVRRRCIVCILLLILLCILPVCGTENLNASVQENLTHSRGPGSDPQFDGAYTFQNILASVIFQERPHVVRSENVSDNPADPGPKPDRDPNATAADGQRRFIPLMETGSAYIIFLLTFGLSALLLVVLSRAGKKPSAHYSLDCRQVTVVALAAAYLLLGMAAGFLSVPILSFFSALMITGDLFWIGGLVAFSIVYLFLSSFFLSYAVFHRSPLVLVQAAHPIPALALMVIFWAMAGTVPRPPIEGMIYPGILVISVVLPVLHVRCLTRHQGTTDTSSSSPTLVSGEARPSVRIVNGFPSELEERYDDAEIVGQGGMALVFRARRRSDGKTVAVKVPTRYDEATGHCFMTEMQIWKELRHKNIVEVYAYNILPVPFVEMEFVGPSLAERETPVPPGEAVSLVRGIAEGLAYAHAAGLIHRDIKPGNILIAPDGTPKITDWGLGKEMTDRKETLFVAFSLDYAAPEQISPNTYGRADARTDIFQLGAVFYELLTGKLPFSGEGIGEVSVSILTTEPLPPSEVSETLRVYDAVVRKCLEKDPEQRYQSIEDLLSDLDALPGGSF